MKMLFPGSPLIYFRFFIFIYIHLTYCKITYVNL